MITSIKVRTLSPNAKLPLYATHGASGLDLVSLYPVLLLPGTRAAVPTGLAIEIPEGFEGQIRPRSGLALSKGVTVLNAPGTIDSDFRGEIQVILHNTDLVTVAEIQPGDRIAQLVIAPIARVALELVNSLNDTERGSGGFGSTGA